MSTTLAAPALTDAQAAAYRRDGYLVVHDLLTRAQIDDVLNHREVTPEQAIAGGLRLHTTHPQFRMMAHHPTIVGMARQLLGGRPMIVQTMFLGKPAGGKGIAPHQDLHYLPNEPRTLMACWVALSDTDGDNGGLCVLPGSHANGLRETHFKKADKDHDEFEAEYEMRDRDGKTWKQKMARFEITGLREEELVKLTVPAGAGVFFDGLTVHGSFGNHSKDRPRLAFATHYVKEGTWLFRTDVQELAPTE